MYESIPVHDNANCTTTTTSKYERLLCAISLSGVRTVLGTVVTTMKGKLRPLDCGGALGAARAWGAP